MKINKPFWHKFLNVLILVLILAVASFGVLGAAPMQESTPTPAPVVTAGVTVTPVPTDPAPADGAPLTLPDFVPLLLTAGLTYLITAGLKDLSKTLTWVPNLEGQATALVGALVASFVTIGNAALALVPSDFVPLVVGIFGTIGSILSAYGIAGIVRSLRPTPPPAVVVEKTYAAPGKN